MAAMTNGRSSSSLGPQFNPFLFASIEEGASEPLSVVSVLARLDLDPWEEAFELTQLPRETAVQRLGALLTKLPSGDPAHSESQTVALRLIALLPGPASPGAPRASNASGASAHIDPIVVILLLILTSFLAMAASALTGQPLEAQVNVTSAPVSGTALSKVSPPKAQS